MIFKTGSENYDLMLLVDVHLGAAYNDWNDPKIIQKPTQNSH